jgi:fumarate hydratase class I
LIKSASTDLPSDVEVALRKAWAAEEDGSPARDALETILANVALARRNVTPMCQDTGTLLFHIDYPSEWSAVALQKQIETAVATATGASLLRPNAVDSLTGENSGNNLGSGLPSFYWHEWQEPYLRARLMLKGGGSENVGVQYSLPDAALGAARDLAGVRRVALHSIQQAQGRGCSPGILGICIGGDRGQGYSESKKQLLRPLDDINPNEELAKLEQLIFREGNSLGIGPMGFGGKATILGVKIGCLHRLPASYFVTVSYMCWACRRRQLIYRGEGDVEIA